MKTAKALLSVVLLAIVAVLLSVSIPLSRARASSVASFGEFVTISTGQQIWVEGEFISADRPTKMIFNGLTNSATESFRALSKAFLEKGYNVIRFDFPGQAKTLAANLNLEQDFGYKAQVQVVKELMPIIAGRLGLTQKIDVLGQSYGAGILLAALALEPRFSERYFRSVAAFAPYTEPLRSQDQTIRREMKWWRTYYPTLPYTDQELYDMIFYRTVMSQYWWYEPEIIGPTPMSTKMYLEGVHALAKGIRPFNANAVTSSMPESIPVNLIKATSDQYIPGDVIPTYWNSIPNSKRGLFINIFGSEHKMLQFVPRFSADIADLVANPPAIFPRGTELDAFALTKRVHQGDTSYDIQDLLKARKRSPLMSGKAVIDLGSQVGASASQCSDVFAAAN